jgi:hypothetical protein
MPSIKRDGSTLGMIANTDMLIDLKINKNIRKTIKKTTAIDRI